MEVDFSNYYHWLNEAYWPAVDDVSRFQLFKGGSGSGKSHFIAQDEVYKQIFAPGSNLLIVRQTNSSNRTSTFPLIKQVMGSFGVLGLFHIRETDMAMRCLTTGNEIKFGGLDDVEKVKSMTFANGPLTRIWVEEATETREESFNQLNLRLRGQADVPFQVRLSFNPVSALNWIKSRFYDSDDERSRSFYSNTTYKDNAYNDKDYRHELERLKGIDRTFYEVYCLGNWGVFGNLIFSNWKAERCPYSIGDFDEVISGMDFGFNHPLACEMLGLKDGVLWAFDELYVREKTNMEVIDIIGSSGMLQKNQLCVADSAEPARIKEWGQKGYYVEGAKKGKDSVSRGIDYIKSLDWRIDPDKCPGLLAEVQTYSYKVDRNGQRTDDPVNFKDDAIAAVRYALEDKSQSLTRGFFAV